MKTKIYFKMQKTSEIEVIYFNGDPTISEITNFFEESCGGVYKWWI